MFTLTVRKPRPDFRVFIDLLFGPGRNVDTDGDADPVWSRDWRELSITDRESDAPTVEIHAVEGLIEIEDGVLENSVTEEAARHVESCPLCTEWLDQFYPDRAERRKESERRRSMLADQ